MARSPGGTDFEKVLRTIGPMAAAAAFGGVMNAMQNRGNFKFRWDGGHHTCGTAYSGAGVPLDELYTSGETPRELVLAGADNVVVTTGEDLAITVQGDDEAKETLRFRLTEGALHIASRNSSHGGEGIATVTVTMPAPHRVTIAGSGQIAVSELAKKAEIRIAGSGQISVLDLDIKKLKVTLAGSGRFAAGGKAGMLKLKIAGSGRAEMAGLLAANAKVHIAGSGSSSFACDGEVKARIFGSGNVTIRGRANCQIQSMGSGWVRVEPREDKNS